MLGVWCGSGVMFGPFPLQGFKVYLFHPVFVFSGFHCNTLGFYFLGGGAKS